MERSARIARELVRIAKELARTAAGQSGKIYKYWTNLGGTKTVTLAFECPGGREADRNLMDLMGAIKDRCQGVKSISTAYYHYDSSFGGRDEPTTGADATVFISDGQDTEAVAASICRVVERKGYRYEKNMIG